MVLQGSDAQTKSEAQSCARKWWKAEINNEIWRNILRFQMYQIKNHRFAQLTWILYQTPLFISRWFQIIFFIRCGVISFLFFQMVSNRGFPWVVPRVFHTTSGTLAHSRNMGLKVPSFSTKKYWRILKILKRYWKIAPYGFWGATVHYNNKNAQKRLSKQYIFFPAL